MPTYPRMRKVGETFLARGTAVAFFLLAFLGIGRYYGAPALGLYQLFFSAIVVLSTLATLGSQWRSMQDMALVFEADNRELGRQAMFRNMRTAAAGGSIIAAAAAAGWYFVGPNGSVNQDLTGFGFVVSATILPLTVLRPVVEALKASGSAHVAIFLETGAAPALVAAVVTGSILLHIPVGIIAILWVHFAAVIMSLLVGGLLIVARIRTLSQRETPVRPKADKGKLGFALVGPASLFLVNGPILLLPAFFSAAEIGVFSAAFRLVQSSGMILTTLGAYYGPIFARLYARGDLDVLRQEYRSSQVYATTMFVPIFLLFLILPSEILSLFGSEFSRGFLVLRILAVGELFNVATGLIGFFLLMVTRPWLELSGLTTGMVVLGGLLVALAPLGIVGAAIAVASAGLSRNLLGVFLVYQLLSR